MVRTFLTIVCLFVSIMAFGQDNITPNGYISGGATLMSQRENGNVYEGLYTADGKTLIRANLKTEGNYNTFYFYVKEGTTTIAANAFNYEYPLQSSTYIIGDINIYIPESVKYISPDAFNKKVVKVVVYKSGNNAQ